MFWYPWTSVWKSWLRFKVKKVNHSEEPIPYNRELQQANSKGKDSQKRNTSLNQTHTQNNSACLKDVQSFNSPWTCWGLTTGGQQDPKAKSDYSGHLKGNAINVQEGTYSLFFFFWLWVSGGPKWQDLLVSKFKIAENFMGWDSHSYSYTPRTAF